MTSRLLLVSVVVALPLQAACGREDTPEAAGGGPAKAASQISGGTQPSGAPPVVQTVPVEMEPGSAKLSLAGRIAYTEDGYSRVSSALQGRVIQVHVRLGEAVKRGQVLVTIESPEIAAAYSEYIKEHSDLAYAKRAYDLAKDLYAIKALALKDVRQAENDFVKAQAEFRRARERLLALQVPASELTKSPGSQRITSQYRVRSAIAGTVVERNVAAGQSVSGDPGQVLMVIADLAALQVIADVYEKDLSLLQVRQPVTVTVEAYPETTFPAVITTIGDVVDPMSRTIKLRASLDNSQHKLKPEMFARLEVELRDGIVFPMVPREAVLEVDGQTYVYVSQPDGRFTKQAVRVGVSSGPKVPVFEGLSQGDRVVTKGAILLKGKDRAEKKAGELRNATVDAGQQGR